MTLLSWLTFLLKSRTVILKVLFFGFTYIFWHQCLLYNSFPSIWKFWSCCCPVSIGFPNSNGMPHFIVVYNYFHSNWDGLRDQLRDVPWENIFKIGASATTSKLCDWGQVWIDVYITYWKYQVKPKSSPLFSVSCAAAIVHRNDFFHLYQQNKSFESKEKFKQDSNRYKRVLEAANFAYGNKTRIYHFPETWPSSLLADC